jgi:hypothetical protein
MKLLKIFPVFLLISVLYKPIRLLLNRYKFGVYYLDTEEILEQDPMDNAMDLRGTPTHECVCGSAIWNLQVTFEDYEIGTYFLEMQCAECGSLATAPTPLDREKTE